ncbi:MAG: diguanylate cyclase [Mariprofundus sp.]
MTGGKQKSYTEVFALLADASNRMHGSFDIAAIVHVAIQTALALADAKAGATALMLDSRLAFSEQCTATDHQPLSCRFGKEVSWVGELLANCTSFIISDQAELKLFAKETGHCFPVTEQLIVVPVIGAEQDLIACLLLFAKEGRRFSADDSDLLGQLASMMSVAIENSIQQLEKSRIEADLEKSVATYRTLVEQIPAITYIATLDRSRILFVSPQVEDILGYRQDEFLAHQETWLQQIHPDDQERVLREVRLSLQDKAPFHCEYRICAKDGRDIWVKDAATTVRDHEHDIYLQGIVYDISERKISEQKLMTMAHFDQLTGLANRSLFHDRLDQIAAQSKRHKNKFAILYLDLDGFKAVNDRLGHQAGDELLVKTAQRLKACVRAVDTVARMGGDEFTIILDDVHSQATIELIANKLINAVATPYEHIGPDLQVTVSVGIAMYPDDSTNCNELITAADNAMYKAKKGGKNRYYFHRLAATD